LTQILFKITFFTGMNVDTLNLGYVWDSSQQLHELLWAVFFIKHLFLKQLREWSCFSSPLTKIWVGMKLKKIAYCSSLPHFSLSSMHEVVVEAILPNIFFKTAQLHLESCSWSYFLKKIALLVKLSYAKQASTEYHSTCSFNL